MEKILEKLENFGISVREGIWPLLGWLAILFAGWWVVTHGIPDYVQWMKEVTTNTEFSRRQSLFISVERKTEVRIIYPVDQEENRKARGDAAPLLWSLEQMRFRGVNAGAYEGVIPGVPYSKQGKCVVYAVPNWGVRVECARPDMGLCLIEKTAPDFVGAVVVIEGFLRCSAANPLP